MIVIADIGIGNSTAVANMFEYLEVNVRIESDWKNLGSVSHLVLPGVGNFEAAMKRLISTEWDKAILNLSTRTNILGICLGMQLLCKNSEESTLEGLDLISTSFKRFSDPKLPVPNMGWRQIEVTDDNILFKNLQYMPRFYFAHSYYGVCENQVDIAATSNYGLEFVAAVNHQNIFGVQFHPEKSHRYGMQLLRNFAEL